MNNKTQAYQTTTILGKSQLDLVIQVYDGIIKAFAEAKSALEKNNNSRAYEQLERAKKFLTHLYTTLNTEQGGDIAEKLGEMYAYVINQINVIEAVKDPGQIDDNMTIINNLRMGWIDLKNQLAEQKTADAAVAQPAASGFATSA